MSENDKTTFTPPESGTVEENSTPRAQTHPAGAGSQRFSVFGGLQSILIAAFLIASLFTLFTPSNLFSGEMLNRVFKRGRPIRPRLRRSSSTILWLILLPSVLSRGTGKTIPAPFARTV